MTYFKKVNGIRVWDDIDDPCDINPEELANQLASLTTGELLTAQMELISTMNIVQMIGTAFDVEGYRAYDREVEVEVAHAEKLRATICQEIDRRLD